MNNFLIFALERSGSTSLASALNVNNNALHEPLTSATGEFKKKSSPYLDILQDLKIDISLLPEASFNPYFNKLSEFTLDPIWMNKFLTQAFSSYRCIKHVWNTLPPQGNFNLLAYCRSHKIPVIYQFRNCYESVVSNLLANQVKVFHIAYR